MADYHQLLVRALTGLGKNPDEAWRAAIYARARGALVIELCGVTPPLSDAEITSECLLFEEAIRKVEADLTHRPPSAAGVSTPLPPATQCPQQKFDQGGLPMRERESSPEAYKPTRSVRPFGSLEPPSEIPDQCFPPCPIAARMSEAESRSDISMGEGINGYKLDKLVADFRNGTLWEFADFEYETCRKDLGIERRFRGEVFYRAADNVFLGMESRPAIVAALGGRVYKIYFGFIHVAEKDCREFLSNAIDHFEAKYGPPSGTREINREQKTVFWDKSFGNVTLEMNSFWCRNAVIYTSSTVQPKKRAWLGRILRNV
jgi:hypothetical protein